MNNDLYMFLDIDGVLNGNFHNELYEIFQFDIQHACFTDPRWGNGDYVLGYKLGVLANICKHFDVKVVVVSSWSTRQDVRGLDLTDLSKVLGDINVVDTSSGSGGMYRAKFVLDYVTRNKIEKFLIVDDSAEKHYGSVFKKENCIFPHGRYGLQDFHFEEIYAYYNNSIKWVYKHHSKKYCSNCNSENLVQMPSLNLKICGVCGLEIDWPLEKGQKSLVSNNRIKG